MNDGSAHAIEYDLFGLDLAAEIKVDRWGIPHIRAQSKRDAFFVQGFNAGRDRLWQLDIWRKRGLGELARDFGPGFLAQDRAARLFLYRKDMAKEWAAYGDCDAKSTAEAFTAGLNAWIRLTERRPDLLAPEFGRFQTRPARWDAQDVVRIRSHARANNLLSEAARARVLAHGGLRVDIARKALHPRHTPIIPEGVAYDKMPSSVLDVFRLATAPLDLTAARLAATIDDAWRWSKVSELGEVRERSEPDGSNNWVVAGARTASGRPILASDPHRVHTLPSLRYLVHLTAPEFDVIGAGEPALPGIAIGHNGCAAFGLTIFPMDQEDLYVYETDPRDPHRYRYEGRWETLTIEHEQVCVRGHDAQDVVLKFTRHGPVVHEDTTNNLAYGVRTIWTEPGSSAYFASLGYLGAKTPEAFGHALEHWAAPAVNQVYADVAGNIGWFVAGKAPRRPNWDGLLPVPGDGRYEWHGFTPLSDLPRSINPSQGFFATANEYNLPPDYPASDRRLCIEWNERSRATRINETLAAQSRHTVAQSMALQCDVMSIPARRVVRLLGNIDRSQPELALALDLLSAWDHRLSPESGAAALFEIWWMRHLKPALLDRLAPEPPLRQLLEPGDNETLLAWLEDPGSSLGDPAGRGRSEMLADTLSAAFDVCRTLMGPDSPEWAWGKLHQSLFTHPMSAVSEPKDQSWCDVGPFPVGGSESTPLCASYRPGDFRVVNGASLRLVVDVGHWDESRVINAPGQSGNVGSRHYDDQAARWANGEYVPLLYSQAAVDAATELTIRLRPAAAP